MLYATTRSCREQCAHSRTCRRTGLHGSMGNRCCVVGAGGCGSALVLGSHHGQAPGRLRSASCVSVSARVQLAGSNRFHIPCLVESKWLIPAVGWGSADRCSFVLQGSHAVSVPACVPSGQRAWWCLLLSWRRPTGSVEAVVAIAGTVGAGSGAAFCLLLCCVLVCSEACCLRPHILGLVVDAFIRASV